MIGDDVETNLYTQVNGVDLSGNTAEFVPYVYIYTSSQFFYSTPTLYLINVSGAGDNTIAWANVSLQVATNAVLISQQPTPAALSLYSGATATFTAAAIGTNTISYRWLKNGGKISDAGKFSGTATPSLMIANVSPLEAASYSMVASVGTSSVTSQVAVLTVANLLVTQPLTPTAMELYAGGTASFTFAAEGNGTTSYEWLKNGTKFSEGGKYSGTGTTNLVVTSVSSTEVGTYSAVATVTAGSVTQAATLRVVTLPAAGTYAAAVLNLKPMGYWRFSDGGGTHGFDYIEGNNVFDALGSPLQAGPRAPAFSDFESGNTAMYMNGTTRGYAGTSQMFNSISNFTIMGWFNINPDQYPLLLNANGRASLFGEQWTAELAFYQGTNLYYYAQGLPLARSP